MKKKKMISYIMVLLLAGLSIASLAAALPVNIRAKSDALKDKPQIYFIGRDADVIKDKEGRIVFRIDDKGSPVKSIQVYTLNEKGEKDKEIANNIDHPEKLIKLKNGKVGLFLLKNTTLKNGQDLAIVLTTDKGSVQKKISYIEEIVDTNENTEKKQDKK